jgi:SAM-dependent methyltransferase
VDLRERDPNQKTRHPWESARLRFVLDKLAELSLPVATRALDVGCGDAYVACAVQRALGCRVTAIDTELPDTAITADSPCPPPVAADNHDGQGPTAARLGDSTPGTPLAERATGITFVNRWANVPAATFDLALLLDVIEHVEDDASFLRQVLRKLRPSAHLLLTVPAFAPLFSAHDRFLGHFRRYTRRELAALMASLGLRVQQSGYLFFGPLWARSLSLVRERLLGAPSTPHGVGQWRHGPRLTQLVHRYLCAENRLVEAARSRDVRLPGLSAWALCNR